MRNNFLKIVFNSSLVILLVGGIGCKKEFLKDPKPASGLSELDVYNSPEGVRSYFNGIYRYMRMQYGGAGTQAGSTDAWGITSVQLARVVKGYDIMLPGSSWYYFDYQIDNREPTYRRVTFTWRFFYEIINQVNNLISGVEKSTTLSDAQKKVFIAEGKALRAICHFEIYRDYCHAYSENPNGKGIPYYLIPSDASTEGNPRGTVTETFTAILKDLTEALPDISTTRQMKDVVNKSVVLGYLARVYLEKADYANAAKFAIDAQAGYTLDRNVYNAPFNNIEQSDVMWGFPQSSDQTIYYGTVSSFYGGQGNGYDNFYIDTLFVHKFSPTDIRSQNFYETGEVNSSGARLLSYYKTNKFGDDINFSDHLISMRMPEMILIEAEAKIRSNDATGHDVLFKLQSNRDPVAVKSSNTGNALINELLLERRKELYGEFGVSFLDVKRLGLPYTRDAGHPVPNNLNLAANSPRLTLKIPQVEFDANKALDPSTDQNP